MKDINLSLGGMEEALALSTLAAEIKEEDWDAFYTDEDLF
jgi:hypothetical protein